MYANVDAFSEELQKISEAQDPVTKERAVRALKGALAAGAGYGLGWGAGNLLMNSKTMRKFSPSPHVMGAGLAGAALLAQFANERMKHKFRKYVAEGDPREKKDSE